jgi:glutamyl-tRNA synthetase
MTITDFKETTTKVELRHKRNPKLGEKTITVTPQLLLEGQDGLSLSVGEEVTMMDIGNVVVDAIDKEGKTITAHSNLSGSVKNTKKLTWLPTCDTLPCTIVEFDHLITVKKLDEKMDFEKAVNPITKAETEMIGDPNLRTLARGDKLQLERRGYFIVEQPYLPGHGMILNLIPDGERNPGFKRKIDIKW